ncbi:hypothetical protein NPIL_91861 [Nephila pilipes]|uniref:Uncharacterized protein n=1 Tax=Nephila pilipes TaxID=299642 RepID=A0A8X6TQV9_NEPPI|nr:hypothetical protein NPIL_91861 [Nephila pilipes]
MQTFYETATVTRSDDRGKYRLRRVVSKKRRLFHEAATVRESATALRSNDADLKWAVFRDGKTVPRYKERACRGANS